AGVEVAWHEGDAESLPFPDACFDVVLSQFGHMFAPRPEVAIREMLRVLRTGGRIAFATWPPEQFVGRGQAMSARYVPPPAGAAPPGLWGEIRTIQERLGAAVRDLFFERGIMSVPALSPEHYLQWQAAKVGPFIRAMAALQKEPERLAEFRREYLALVREYLVDNIVRQEYLLTRGIKA
ncbi:MAG TPA: class I SAM-dependent methyltransferase, partial [Planctomycetota bacterium]|nr:class I SAM-dependent methyltransferase [Planctomycetota bacterium]